MELSSPSFDYQLLAAINLLQKIQIWRYTETDAPHLIDNIKTSRTPLAPLLPASCIGWTRRKVDFTPLRSYTLGSCVEGQSLLS